MSEAVSTKKTILNALIIDCLIMFAFALYAFYMGIPLGPLVSAVGFIVIFFLLFGLMS